MLYLRVTRELQSQGKFSGKVKEFWKVQVLATLWRFSSSSCYIWCEVHFYNFRPKAVMYWKTFVCFCRQILRPIHIFFSAVHFISSTNSIHKFQDIWRIFIRVTACRDGHIDRKTNQMHKHFSTLLENVKIHWTQLKGHFQA